MLYKIIALSLLIMNGVAYSFEVTVTNKTGFDIEITRIMPPLALHDEQGQPTAVIGKTRVLGKGLSVKLFAKKHGLADLSVQGIFKGKKVGPQTILRSASKKGFTGNQSIDIYYSEKLHKFYYKVV